MLNLDGDDVDPRMERVVQTLGAKLESFRGAFVTDHVVKKIDEVIRDHRATWRMRGVDVPRMVALVIPEVGAIEVLRQDLEVAGIQAAVVGIVKKYPKVSREGLAHAFFRAFPDYVTKLQSSKPLHIREMN